MRLAWLFIALILTSLMAGIHLYALPHFLYWYFPYLDVFMHLLGGAVMASAVIGFLGAFKPKTFFLALVIGSVGWELFELMINNDREANFLLDTSLDLLMDALGASIMYLLARFTIWRSA